LNQPENTDGVDTFWGNQTKIWVI